MEEVMIWNPNERLTAEVPEYGLEIVYRRPGAATIRKCVHRRRDMILEDLTFNERLAALSGDPTPAEQKALKAEADKEKARREALSDEQRDREDHDRGFVHVDSAELVFLAVDEVKDKKSGAPAFDVNDVDVVREVPQAVVDAIAKPVYDAHYVRAETHRGN